MDKITIIDGNSLLFRAYFATAYPGVEIMHNQEGIPTNAIFAFSNMLNKIVNSLKEKEKLFVAFDAGKHNFRHDALESYKANRKPAPEDLVTQFPIAREFLKCFGVYQFEEVGFEGDDIAGTVAKLAEKEGMEVHLYTSDRDFLQLVNDNITVHIIRKGLSDVVEMTPATVKETYGFEPIQIIDYKGLRGDTSDNLPGIPGVGEKTAVKLIEEYHDFDNIIAHAPEIKGKLGEMIIQNQEIGRISRDLAIIKTDIELPFSLSELTYEGYDFDTINTFCTKYGLKQFINKIPTKWKKKSLNDMEINVEEITTFENVIFEKNIGIAIDFEADYARNGIYGIAIENNNHHYYISLENAKKDKFFLDAINSKDTTKFCYDYKAIKVALALNDIKLQGNYFDILLASYLLDSSLKNNPDQVMNIFGVDLGKDEQVDLFSSNNIKRTNKIAYFSLNLYSKVKEELEKIEAFKLYEELEIPLADTLADMEIEGFPLNALKLDEFGNVFKQKADSLAKEVYEMAGETFNINSPKQIGEILFNKLGLKGNKKMSTSVDNLKDLVDEHPIVSKILEYRKYFKLISTYIEGLKPHIFQDGKIHAHFNQALTTTGRLSSSNPNLQNISIRDEEGKLIRQAFYYPNEEYQILSLDYSQIELRILAALSNCKPLKDIFETGLDIHSQMAKTIFHLEEEPTSNQRRKAKAVNFGIIYGISDYGLSEQIDISIKEAHDIIDSFYKSFPEVGNFFSNIVEEAKNNGYVSTLLGRRRYLRELHDSNYQVREFAKRAAMNAPIQGTAADLIKVAMIKVNNALKENKLETKMVLQIHDELIFKVPTNEKEKAYNLIKSIMENAMNIGVKLEVDGGFGKDWYSCK